MPQSLTLSETLASILVMLSIRLKRIGSKNDPSFRLIVQDRRRHPTKGNVVEYLGNYDARKGKPSINGERVTYWLGQGAQATETVHNLLVDAKVIKGKKVNAHNSKTPVKKEVPAASEKSAASKEEVKEEVSAAPEVADATPPA